MGTDDFREQLAKIKESYNIVDFIANENVDLKPAGPGKYKALCPFHTEKTPSFSVDENFQSYRCFGCGKHGDIVSFVEELQQCSFRDAVSYLAEMKNIKINFGNTSNNDDKPRVDIKSLYSLLQDSYNFYRAEFDKLPNSHPAKQEIIKRGLNPENAVFCYAPERYGALVNFLESKGYSKLLMTQSQLVSKKNGKYYDFFFGRLMITLSDFSGHPVSYSARKLFDTDTRAKYVNGKQSPIFQKKSTLFNLDKSKRAIRESKSAIVCEGPFDVLALNASGINNAVASCGTAFTEEQLRSLEQIIGIDGNLEFSFDGDDAGISAAVKTFLHFPIVHGNSSVILFPDNLDPCDYLVKYGPEKMKIPLSKKIPIIDFVLEAISTRMKLDSIQTKFQFASLVMSKYVPAVTDEVLRDYMIRRVSVIAGIQVEKLTPMLGKPIKKFDKNVEGKKNNLVTEIEIDDTDSDTSFITAFVLLIHRPEILYPLLKNTNIPDKYKTFVKELGVNCRKYFKQKIPIRIIPEQYSQPNFIKFLQNKNLLIDYYNDEQVKSHFTEVLFIANSSLKQESITHDKLSISEALSNAKTKEEMLKLLELAQKNK